MDFKLRNILASLFGAFLIWSLNTGDLVWADGHAATEKTIIALPAPDKTGGMPLMAALNARRSERSFKSQPLSEKQLANVLWSAVGVNRPKGTYRTTPTSHNYQDLYVYFLNENGAFRYDAIGHQLELLTPGSQTRAAGAPLLLAYVAPTDSEAAAYNTGFAGMSVYLYAASEGLSSIVKGSFDRQKLTELFKLGDDKKIHLIQLVGPSL